VADGTTAAMFVQRMMTDEAFRQRVLSEKSARDAVGCDVTAEDWQDVLADLQSQEAARKEAEDGHERMAEIRVIAQALAFRDADAGDAEVLEKLANDAYAAEREGRPEGFRTTPCVDLETVQAMIEDPDCHWILAEAPRGMNAVVDGQILGCACYSVGAAAAKTPEKVGAIRLLAVLPAFLGLLVGRRLIRRVEEAMRARACTRALCCVPECRRSVLAWAARRGYEQSGVAQYPKDLASTFSRPTRLLVVSKPFTPQEKAASRSVTAGGGNPNGAADKNGQRAEAAKDGEEPAGQTTGPVGGGAGSNPKPPSPSSHGTMPPPPPGIPPHLDVGQVD